MKKKIFTSVSVLAMTMFISACTNFLDVNTDPTRLKTAQINQAFTAAEVSAAFYMGTDLYLYSTLFTQQGTGSGVSSSQTRFYDSYIVTNTDVNNIFSNFYAGSLADFDYVKKQGFATGNPTYAGVSKILEAYVFSTMVDAWGNIPYKEALKGVGNVQPKYDDSKEVYDSLFLLIDAGIAQTKLTNSRPMSGDDLIYAGDMAKWQAFGNTLKLRMALNYAKADGGAKLNALIAAGGPFITQTSSFQMAFDAVTARQNPIQQFETSRQDYYAPGQTLINMMNTKNDPRRGAYFTSYPAGATVGNVSAGPFAGTPSNATQTNPNSRIHTYLRGAVTGDTGARVAGTGPGSGAPTAAAVTYTGSAPMRMLQYSEYCFIRAEAALMYGGTLADAQTWYQAGIRASIADVNATIPGAISTADADLYVTTNGTLTGLQQIIEEKYVATYGTAMTAWNDWRRTGFPALSPSAAGSANGNNTIPRVLVYPLSETQTNISNLPARAGMTVKSVFWDK